MLSGKNERLTVYDLEVMFESQSGRIWVQCVVLQSMSYLIRTDNEAFMRK